MKQEKITEENLLHLQEEDKTANVFRDWCQDGEEQRGIQEVIRSLTVKGIFKYSL